MYQPSTGRFTTLDPFFGDEKDPQSFNKYLYTHADPINGVDPTGQWNMMMTIGVTSVVGGLAALGTYVYLDHRFQRNSLLGPGVLDMSRRPGNDNNGDWAGTTYLNAIYPQASLDDYFTLRLGCVGLLRIRLGQSIPDGSVEGRSSFNPHKEIEGTRGFTTLQAAEEAYRQFKADGKQPWLYAIQTLPAQVRPPTMLDGGAGNEFDVQTLTVHEGSMNFGSLLFYSDGRKVWEDMPFGIMKNPMLTVHRRPFDSTTPHYGLPEQLDGNPFTDYYIVSPKSNTMTRVP